MGDSDSRLQRAIDWSDFVSRYRALAVRFIDGLIRDSDGAEELFQKAMLELYQKHQEGRLDLESPAHARNYLLRMLRNLAADHHKSPRRKKAVKLEAVAEPVDPGKQPWERAEAGLAEAKRKQELSTALASLRPAEREALRMRFSDGQPFREMAALTGEPISTLQARVEAGLKKIRKNLGKIDREEK